MTPGTVYLVGAGPGDDGLIALRGAELVAAADVVLYDRLIAHELLSAMRPDAEAIPVGKTAGDHSVPQDAINQLLVDHAKQGKLVVRLKGGDPYLFGRGGEEALFCAEHGVPFCVIPAITSAFAVPAAAGIPVTHRGVSTHVTVITASAGPTGSDEPDYAWLAQSTGTVVLLMGLRRAGAIAERFIEAGAPPSRPMAVISRGCTAEQQTITGTLADMPATIAAAQLPSPGIIVIGDVVRLREHLNWFENRPLFGRTVAVTRARAQASDLAALLQEAGARVEECPTIRIDNTQPPVDVARTALQALGTTAPSRVLLFTSVNGARQFFAGLQELGWDARHLAGTQVGVVGTATAAACRAAGIEPDIIPDTHTSPGLLQAVRDRALTPGTAVLIRAQEGSDELLEGLDKDGWDTTLVVAYRTVVEPLSEEAVRRVQHSDLITFTAASTVRNLAATAPDSRTVPAVSIGPRTTAAAQEAGYTVIAQAQTPTVEALAQAVVQAVAHPAGELVATQGLA